MVGATVGKAVGAAVVGVKVGFAVGARPAHSEGSSSSEVVKQSTCPSHTRDSAMHVPSPH